MPRRGYILITPGVACGTGGIKQNPIATPKRVELILVTILK